MSTPSQPHIDVGAYVLGVLDNAEVSRFEAHLRHCPMCAEESQSLSGLKSILSDFADSVPDVDAAATRPGDQLLDQLLTRVTAQRARSRRRRLTLVAASAVLIVGGPVTAATLASSAAPAPPANAAHQLLISGERRTATDPATRVSATVAMQDKAWGTQVGLRLGDIRGPLDCDLVAVSSSGTEQTVMSWTVPEPGYGVDGHDPLEASGGAAMKRAQIDHFEVRTLDGDHLVNIAV